MNSIFPAHATTHFPLQLPHGVEGRLIDLTTYFEIEDRLEPLVFPEHPNLERHFSTPADRQNNSRQLSALQRQTHQEAIAFYVGDEVIGWAAGRMENASEFLMDVTGIVPSYQGKGIYSAFLKSYLPYLRDVGYERVISYHSPTNRAVLIAKLKVGFVIRGMMFRENAGASVQLVYFFHEDRFRAFEDAHSLQPGPYTNSDA